MSGNARTSVLIATRNRPDLLESCLESLRRTGLPAAEVLVLDQSDDGRSKAVVDALSADGSPIRHVALPAPGKSRALNVGLDRAAGERIALTDDDCEVADDWLSAIDREFEIAGREARVVIAGRVLPGRRAPDGTPPPSCISDPEPRDYAGRLGREVVYQNWAAPRRAFEEAGRFDERLGPGEAFPSAEDNDMAYRWLVAGYRVLYRPSVTVWHHGWRTREQLRELKWTYGLGQGAFYAKHLRSGDLHAGARLVRDTLRIARTAAAALVKADPASARNDATFLAALWLGATRMARRKQGHSSFPGKGDRP